MSDDDAIIGYFGPLHMKKGWELLVPAPVGQKCLLCEETIAEDDIGTINRAGQVIHYECNMRAMIGSVGHQMKRCSCFGGTDDEDPPGLTRRQAAQAALDLWTATRQ